MLFKMASNQTECTRLEQKSLIKILVVEKCKRCKIYRRMCNVYREVLVQKMFTNGLNMSLLKRCSMELKHTDSLVKKKFWAQQSVKKIILTVF